MKLNSLFKYVQRVLACEVYPLEREFRPHQVGPAMLVTAAGPGQFAGRTAIASGDVFKTISTQVVNSDSIIMATLQVNTTTASGSALAMYGVNSIVSGISFAFGAIDGVGRAIGGTIMWEIKRTS